MFLSRQEHQSSIPAKGKNYLKITSFHDAMP